MSNAKNKVNFEVKLEDDKVLKLAVLRPNEAAKQKAQLVYAKSLKKNLDAGLMLRTKLDSYLREQNVWDDVKQKEYLDLQNQILENEKIVEGKRKGITLEVAKEAAIQLRRDRMSLRSLVAQKSELESTTAEGMAENQRFAFLVSVCTVHADTGKHYYATQEDYEKDEGAVALAAATNFANLWYGIDPDYENNLPENKFLTKYKFCDEKLRLVNAEGKLVDTKGRLIDEEGRYITVDGKYCDIDGNLVDKDGNPLVEEETFPFLT